MPKGSGVPPSNYNKLPPSTPPHNQAGPSQQPGTPYPASQTASVNQIINPNQKSDFYQWTTPEQRTFGGSGTQQPVAVSLTAPPPDYPAFLQNTEAQLAEMEVPNAPSQETKNEYAALLRKHLHWAPPRESESRAQFMDRVLPTAGARDDVPLSKDASNIWKLHCLVKGRGLDSKQAR